MAVACNTDVPAVAETGVPDGLGREPGVAMTSALGFTADHFAAARRTSGERTWYALYEGRPRLPKMVSSSASGWISGGSRLPVREPSRR